MTPPMLLGHIPDAPDPRDWRFDDSRIAMARPITGADSVDYRDRDVPRVQLFSSCVGHAVVASAALCMAIAGTPIDFPSSLFPYSGSRLLARPRQPLQDIGSSARLAMSWLRDRGMVIEARWPETSENVNAVPPLDAFAEGSCATVEAFYSIAPGDGASDGVRSALKRGYCPAFAMMVDTKYEQIGSAVYDGPGGSVLGGHMQCVVGYDATMDAFIVRNTWGAGFGVDGYAYISTQAFNAMARDIWVVQAAPEVR